MQYILTIDQGTTSTRALVFSATGELIVSAQHPITLIYPNPGWVELCPKQLLESVHTTIQKVIQSQVFPVDALAAIGITNQRETTLLWRKDTGEVLGNAIVWQDRRTSSVCDELRNTYEKMITDKTGLCLDPYFSATKLQWLLDNIPNARRFAEQGKLAFGTVESFLIWTLSNGASHVSDMSNASRTLLFNIHKKCWDEDLLQLFNIPSSVLPSVLGNLDTFATVTLPGVEHELPITGVLGDQQAAMIGQGCLNPGDMKCTFGTGAFLLSNTGTTVHQCKDLLSTILYQDRTETYYALEASNFNAGTAIQFCREQLNAFDDFKACETIANELENNHGVYFVPAFTGLGTPYWAPNAKGAIVGLTRDTNLNHITRAALESVGYQTRDLIEVFNDCLPVKCKALKVDGGMIDDQWFLQFLADMLQCEILPAKLKETTAFGASLMASVGVGIFPDLKTACETIRYASRVQPQMLADEVNRLYADWQHAVKQVLI